MNPIATIPMPGDLVELIGPAAERVENRSLLLDKFVFHKKWPEVVDEGGREVKWDEASRWSFMRIADGAARLLERDANEKRRRASGRNVEPANRERLEAEANVAASLGNVRWDGKELADLRSRHTRRFLGLFRSAYGERASILIGHLEGRLAINLADSLIQNAGICLDRLFGLPYIPGSAIKGVCRHVALEELRNAPEGRQRELLTVFCAVFGTAENDFSNGDLRHFRTLCPGSDGDQKGAVSFLPAYPANEARIVVDLTNVHYPDYYQTGRQSDLRIEKPRPNPFPAVEAGAQFAFCVVLNRRNESAALLDHARRWLEIAITVRGLGAKTASGYGWFSVNPEALDRILAEEANEAESLKRKAQELRARAEAVAREAERKASLSPEDVAIEELRQMNDEVFARTAREIANEPEVRQRALVRLLGDDKDKRERWKIWKKKKPDIADAIQKVCADLNLPPLP